MGEILHDHRRKTGGRFEHDPPDRDSASIEFEDVVDRISTMHSYVLEFLST